MSARVDFRPVPVPKPNLTPDEMVARATALQPLLRAEQDATERRGVHSEAIQQELEDRFGPLPQEATTLMDVSRLRLIARDLGIAAVIQKRTDNIRIEQNLNSIPVIRH